MAPVQADAVVGFGELLEELLQAAAESKVTNTIEPALSPSTLGNVSLRLGQINGLGTSVSTAGASQNAVVETAVRDVFNTLLASESIDRPGFVRMWSLLDIVCILSDDDQCDAALLFWLIEELLDSQTIAGCRKVFDYLESRRERITSKNFKSKSLVILRSCNELLRRLSRAEDTAFCGRVFIFLFQCFPLGDKSSVNLRGEYHVENVTAFDTLLASDINTAEEMEVDVETKEPPTGPSAEARQAQSNSRSVAEIRAAAKSVSFDAKNSTVDSKPMESDELYPIFWTLQQSFSQPKLLFETEHLASFKAGLKATMVTFEAIQKEQALRGASKPAASAFTGSKRKREQDNPELSTAFNPKYLTSRDLFELEFSDLTFRRHIAVQALIILDFLLSLSPRAKEKQATITPQNKSVMYQDQVLSEEDTEWAIETKTLIAEYLKKGFEGPFFYRMVETVLSRDKNWVRWKIESCPSIDRPAVSPEEFIKARSAAKKMSTNKRLRPHPQGSLDLNFLSSTDGDEGMERLKKPRYAVPSMSDFRRMIADSEFEIEMPTNDETKEQAITGKASQSWRVLRIASKTKLAVFDKIEDPNKIDVIFVESETEAEADKEDDAFKNEEETNPANAEEVAPMTESLEVEEVIDVAMDEAVSGTVEAV